METIDLSKEERLELKTLYTKLSNLYADRAKLEVVKKDREQILKEEIASACRIVNKQGETQADKVKMPLVNAILDELYREKSNKEKVKQEIMDSYEIAIKNKEVNEDCIQNFISIDENIKENADFIKEVYKESSILSKEILDGLNALLKEEYKNHLNNELEAQGYEVKEPKDKSKLLELTELIKRLLEE